jgi:hypothetical protein
MREKAACEFRHAAFCSNSIHLLQFFLVMKYPHGNPLEEANSSQNHIGA